jgi:uncharacterized membrane protein YdjX (TVP38/TMEM64 family)
MRDETERGRNLAIVLVAVVVLAIVVGWGPAHRMVADAIESAKPVIHAHPLTGGIVFVGLAIVSPLMMFFSSVALVPIAVNAWGAPVTALLLWIGWFLGGQLTYTIGVNLGRPMVRKLLGKERFAKYEHRVPRDAPVMKATLVQLALPSDVGGYLFGMVDYSRQKYMAALAMAELPYAIITAYIGEAFIERDFGMILAGVVVAALAITWFMRSEAGQRTVDSLRAPAPKPRNRRRSATTARRRPDRRHATAAARSH